MNENTPDNETLAEVITSPLPSMAPANGSEGGDVGEIPTQVPDADIELPAVGETETGELIQAPDAEPTGIESIDLITAIAFGVAAVMAIAVVVLSVLLARGRKKKKTEFVPTHDGSISVGKLHEQGDRESQQDCFAVSPAELIPQRGLLAVVADGMGGLADGDKVSQAAVATMLDGFFSTPGEPDDLLLSLTEQANRKINQMLGPAAIGKSGSTLVAGLIRNGRFHYISIGDSRICLFRDGQLIQLNREHIYRHELAIQALSGIGSLQGAATHPKAAGLTSYLGMGQLKYVDIPAQAIEVRSGDKFILMSDGVYNALSEQELVEALAESAEKAAELIGAKIAEKAYRNQDNYTAVILAS